MRRVVAALCSILLPLVSVGAAAAPCVKAVAIGESVTAPCSGLLIPDSDARSALKCLAVKLPTCEADMLYQAKHARAELNGANAMLQASQDHAEELREQLLAITTAPPPPWYETSEFWFGSGAAIGAAAVVAIVYAVGAVR